MVLEHGEIANGSGANEAAAVSHPNASLITTLYRSLSARDHRGAVDCYSDHARFEDIAFKLDGKADIGRMWRLVCSADLRVEIGSILANERIGLGEWVAIYPVVVGNKETDRVRNPTNSIFRFEDNKIVEHRDYCDARAWASQAFPFPLSLVMGSVAPLRQALARAKLRKLQRVLPD